MRWLRHTGRTRVPPSHVFVLGTGRCGTLTFARACEHFTNFTTGHESRAREIGDARFGFADRHIEIDNRLTWFLGSLADRFDDRRTLYVHLLRDRDAVVDSFTKRWSSPYRASVIRAFGHGIVTRKEDWSDDEVRSVCEFYVDTVTANVRQFLHDRRSIECHIETLPETFGDFIDAIGAVGDLDAALGELAVRHNSS